jgi:ribosomal protein S18 acetylase RimI-like enzyme
LPTAQYDKSTVFYFSVTKMSINLSTPTSDALGDIVAALASWQSDTTSHHIHPGDIGWFQSAGAEKTASHLRVWSSAADGTILAIGLLDGDDLLRATTAPSARRNVALADAMAADISDPARGILPAGNVSFDVAPDALVRERVAALDGWSEGEEWSWFRMDLTPDAFLDTSDSVLHVEVVKTPEQVSRRVAAHALAFDRSKFTVQRWQAASESPSYKMARCLLAYDVNDKDKSEPVGAATVWSAGPEKPGILEPVGVGIAHQGRGFGRALCRAAAAELRKMGASRAVVATPSSNVAAVATYKSAGFVFFATPRDLCRES